jgi:hypothetical protein
VPRKYSKIVGVQDLFQETSKDNGCPSSLCFIEAIGGNNIY